MRGRLLNADEIEWWYNQFLKEDFPEHEIKPLKNILKLYSEKKYHIHIYQNSNDDYIGYAAIWSHKGCHTYLLDYLAVRKDMRSQSYGSQIIEDIGGNLIMNDEKASLICESETPVKEDCDELNNLRNRRLSFYTDNHCHKIYEMATCGVRFTVFIYKQVSPNTKLIMQDHRKIYGPERKDVIIPLKDDQVLPKPYWV